MVFFFIVREQTAAIVETLGKYNRIASSGLHLKMPWERVAGRLSLRIQELQVNVETKTKDDVFVRLLIAVQYFVIPEKVREAFYKLSNPVMQIESYVFDEVRSAVPGMTLDDVFQNKDFIANAVKEGLQETMEQYGYGIARALVNDIDPDRKVKTAMNEINAAQRLRKAAEERGEAEKILRVKQAQGEAESKKLQGVGIADQRKAIVDGLRESVQEFQSGVPGVTSADVMQLVLMTQYFDMLKDIGATSRANTILLPHSPGSLGDLSHQLKEAIMVGNLATKPQEDVIKHAPIPEGQEHEETSGERRQSPSDDPEFQRNPLEALPPPDVGSMPDPGDEDGEEGGEQYPRTRPPR